MTSGGHRSPTDHKAVVSGPGRYSRRTDGQTLAQLPNAKYGEQAQFQAAQSGAPMAGTQPVPTPQGQAGPGAMPTPLLSPSQRPWEDVTAAAPPPVPATPQKVSDVLAKYVNSDATGALAALYQNALSKGM